MKKVLILSVSALFLACSGEEKKDEKKNATKGDAEEKCIEFTKAEFGDQEGFKITSSRADKREEVKLALEEKYETDTKFISSVGYQIAGEDRLCTCYINDKNEILNSSELSTN